MTDHKAEAERLIEYADSTGSVSAAVASNTHAVLYLAEQTRLANLIAKQTEIFTGLREGESLVESTSKLHRDLEIAIREGLGL